MKLDGRLGGRPWWSGVWRADYHERRGCTRKKHACHGPRMGAIQVTPILLARIKRASPGWPTLRWAMTIGFGLREGDGPRQMGSGCAKATGHDKLGLVLALDREALRRFAAL